MDVTNMDQSASRSLRYFKDSKGHEPVKEWLDKLRKKNQHQAWALITKQLKKLELGHTGNCKYFGGIGELKIDFGPGYRVYFGEEENGIIVILLKGGDKKTQSEDIEQAKEYWEEYKQGKDNE